MLKNSLELLRVEVLTPGRKFRDSGRPLPGCSPSWPVSQHVPAVDIPGREPLAHSWEALGLPESFQMLLPLSFLLIQCTLYNTNRSYFSTQNTCKTPHTSKGFGLCVQSSFGRPGTGGRGGRMFFCSFLTPCVDPAHSMNLLIVFEVMFFFSSLSF